MLDVFISAPNSIVLLKTVHMLSLIIVALTVAQSTIESVIEEFFV